MVTIELNDIQGLIVKGYGRMQNCRYSLLRITDAVNARAWINKIIPGLTNATHAVHKNCLNIAFTSKGLNAIGMSDENVRQFSHEFYEGMNTDHRQRLLGDYNESDPSNWRWGRAGADIHMMLLFFGATPQLTVSFYEIFKEQFVGAGLEEVLILDGQTMEENKEHFGFRDGFAQPIIAGAGKTGDEFNTVASGEFILGYQNEYKVFPDTPVIRDSQGDLNILPADVNGTGLKDFGRNGSYLVLRQMEQHVDKFWDFMKEKTKNEDGTVNSEESIRLASKMMGRWPSGSPLAMHPDKDPGILTNEDSFEYGDDKDGLKCPFGAHIRRVNPRDTFENNTQKESLRLTKRHRIIRRGRSYITPRTDINDSTDSVEKGLLFLCFNADIGRQFEFLSYTWGNYPNLKELYGDPDPIIGTREIPVSRVGQNFSIQAKPVNQCVTGLKRFVTIRGGAYFFFPSITAVRYLTTI